MNLLLQRVILVLATLLCGGCASLQIKVYSYTGDETYGGDAQLAQAVGVAAHANQTAKELYSRINPQKNQPTFPSRWLALSDPLKAMITDYEQTDNIEALAFALDTARTDTNAYSAARRQLAISLIRYSQRCISMGQRIGVPVEINPFWLFRSADRQLVTAAVGLENSGMKIQRLAANVLDSGDYTPMTSIFKSLEGGIVEGRLDTFAPQYASLVNDSNWKQENVQSFSGTGDLNDVIVKDEIGNWVQKSFSNDPTGIIDATFTGSLMVVNTLAAAYGVPLPKTTGNTTGSSSSSTSTTDQGLQVHANNIAAQLRQLNVQEAEALQQILANGKHDAPEQQAIVTSIQYYQSQISALSGSDSSSGSSTTTATAK